MALFVYHFVFMKSMKVFCVSLALLVLLSICLTLLVRPFTFTEKSDCGNINFVFFVISIMTILVKLLQMICCCFFFFCVPVFLSVYLSFVGIIERYTFHIVMLLCY